MFRRRVMGILSVLSAVGTPFSVQAAFMGPSNAPPQGNVPGVIWNRTTSGGSANEQASTDINISGSARFGGDAILGDGKALRIDKVGSANLYIGNWGNGIQPLTVTISGDVNVAPADTSEGKVTAPKFCLGANCITDWPVANPGGGITGVTAGTGITGGGNSGNVSIGLDQAYGDARYINAGGDTMSGALVLSGNPVNGLDAASKIYVDSSITSAVNGKLNLSGGTMTGDLLLNGNPPQPLSAAPRQYVDSLVAPINAALFNYVLKAGDTMTGTLTDTKGIKVTGVDPLSNTGIYSNVPAGVGISSAAPTGFNAAGTNYSYYSTGNPTFGIAIPGAANTAGFFKGTTYGVDAESPGTAGYFINLTTPTIFAQFANTTYAGAFYSPVGSTSLYAQRNVLIGGDIAASANALSSCAWTAFIADGSVIQCPAANPIMSGVQRSGATERIYCCAL